MIWNMIQRDNIPRISGLLYLRILLQRREVRADGNTVWIMPGEESAKRNLRYLDDQGIKVAERCVYLAPLYGAEVRDELLLDNLRAIRPQHVIITIGGGKARTPRSLYQTESRLLAVDSLHWCSDSVLERGSGQNSWLGGQVVPGLAFPLYERAAQVYSTILARACLVSPDITLS
jgi:hypothetical protein